MRTTRIWEAVQVNGEELLSDLHHPACVFSAVSLSVAVCRRPSPSTTSLLCGPSGPGEVSARCYTMGVQAEEE